MIKFEHLKVYNLLDAIRGMRNPQESWHKMDSVEFLSPIPTHYSAAITFDGQQLFYPAVYLGENDLKLARALSKAGNDHAKYLRQIFVSVDIVAPLYFWKELSTYKVATVANSTSQMHRLGSRTLTEADFAMEDVPRAMRKQHIKNANSLIQTWVAGGKQ